MRYPLRRLGLAAGALILASNAAYAAPLAHADLEAQAKQGDAAAAFALAIRYQNAEGVPRDLEKAFTLYCDAALQGHGSSAFAIGRMYMTGAGAPRDDDQAAAWFRLARDKGIVQANTILRLVRPHDLTAAARCAPEPPPKPAIAAIAPAEIKRLVARLAPRYDIDPALVLTLIKIESGFVVDAVSPKNAHGLMQLLPETAKRFGVRDIFDPEQNVTGGLTYLRWLLDRFDGHLTFALAAYNAGEKAVEQHDGVPPYRETRAYLRKFMAHGFAISDKAKLSELDTPPAARGL
jgi:TPR repeat protein